MRPQKAILTPHTFDGRNDILTSRFRGVLFHEFFFSLFCCRLRHERLKKVPKDVGGPNAYQTLTCFELDDTPVLPSPPSSSSIDDPFDIRI